MVTQIFGSYAIETEENSWVAVEDLRYYQIRFGAVSRTLDLVGSGICNST